MAKDYLSCLCMNNLLSAKLMSTNAFTYLYESHDHLNIITLNMRDYFNVVTNFSFGASANGDSGYTSVL